MIIWVRILEVSLKDNTVNFTNQIAGLWWVRSVESAHGPDCDEFHGVNPLTSRCDLLCLQPNYCRHSLLNQRQHSTDLNRFRFPTLLYRTNETGFRHLCKISPIYNECPPRYALVSYQSTGIITRGYWLVIFIRWKFKNLKASCCILPWQSAITFRRRSLKGTALNRD